MIRKTAILCLLMMCAFLLPAQTDTLRTTVVNDSIIVKNDTLIGNLKVIVKGFRSTTGTALVALYNRAKGFTSNEPLKNAAVKIKATQITVQFDSLGIGNYALAIIHDENNNALLDKNSMGIPIEGYGFSNDARGAFGPPEYKDAKFWFAGKDRSVTINMFYTNAK